ncbi:MarR family winged helix-turn-helix transcriptional regulator [Streptomyces lydicus]|uniref:MarR family winged helix-turn-helix transcriptional regulator n=1 Tax=Streptomyces lydicus TaxID=47763 RepID=UPI0036F89AA1
MGESTEISADDSAEVGAALRLSIGRLMRKVRLAKSPVGDVTLFEASLLARLDRDGPDNPGVLATSEGVRPQAMATTLATLEERGLVSRRRDAADGRRSVVTLTDAGRQVVTDRNSASMRPLVAGLEAEFTPAERRELLAVLPLLDRLTERL